MPLSSMKHMLLVLQNNISEKKKKAFYNRAANLAKNIRGNNARIQLKTDFVEMFQNWRKINQNKHGTYAE